MKNRRILSVILAVILLFAVVPAVSAAESAADIVSEAAAIAKLDKVWARLDAAEAEALAGGAGKAEVISAVFNAALGSALVDIDSFSNMSEDGFLFTVDGMYNQYNYRLRNELDRNVAVKGETTVISYGSKDAGSADVMLVGPYYGGYDTNFTDQYRNEAESIAEATCGNVTILGGMDATGPAIAQHYTNKGVVIYDSHGFASDSSSYLCLLTNAGITSEDYANGWAIRGGDGASIDGRYIENHISAPASNTIVWMSICKAMMINGNGTTANALLRAGVEVVYGYSQSVTFGGDYLYEAVFWNVMKQGGTVAEAVAEMKETYGIQDPYGNAYPIVVSADDPFPENPDAEQEVVSQYTLFGEGDPVALESISVSTDSLELTIGEKAGISYDREPANANLFDAVWVSDDDNVVTYYKGSKSKCMLIATGTGETDVTCSVYVDGSIVYTHTVHVTVTAPVDLSCANAEGGNLSFGTSGDFLFEAAEKDGIPCVRSGNYHKLNSESKLFLVALMNEGDTLSFDYLISSQPIADYCTVSVNGQELFTASGIDNTWENYAYTAEEAGIYIFEWLYVKDSGQSHGDDRLFVANVSLIEYSEPGIPGDVNGDGVVNAADANIAMRMALNLVEADPAGDINGDGVVNTADANIIMRLALGL